MNCYMGVRFVRFTRWHRLSAQTLLSFSNHGRYSNPSIKAELILRADIQNDDVDRANCSHNTQGCYGRRTR